MLGPTIVKDARLATMLKMESALIVIQTQIKSSARLAPPMLAAQSAPRIYGSTRHQTLASNLPVDKLDALTAQRLDPFAATFARPGFF